MSVDSTDVIQALADADEQETREIKQALGIGHTRRDVLKGAAAVGGGAAIGAGAASEMTGEAKADPSTSDSDGNVGLPGDRVDVFAEGIDSNSVDTDEEVISDTGTDPSQNGEIRNNGGVLKAQSDGTVGDILAGWVWTEESGSPYSATGASSITPSNLDAYDEYLIQAKVTNKSGSNQSVNLQIDGDTNSNYNEIDYSGTRNTGQTEIGPLALTTDTNTSLVMFKLNQRQGDAAFHNLTGIDGTNRVETGTSFQAWPPSKFTLDHGGSADWTVRVWGRDA